MHAVSWGILTFCSHGVPCSPHYLWTATFTNIMMAKHYCVPPWNIWSFQTHSTSLTCVVMRQFLEIYFWQFWNQSTSEDKYDDQLNISTRGNRSNGFETENISKNRIDELNLISKLGGWLKRLPRIALISFLCVRFEKLIVVQLPILIQVVLLDRLSWSIFHEKLNSMSFNRFTNCLVARICFCFNDITWDCSVAYRVHLLHWKLLLCQLQFTLGGKTYEATN